MPAVQEYPLFDQWYQTCDWILQVCDRMPKHTRFALSGRIANLALDVTSRSTESLTASETRGVAVMRPAFLFYTGKRHQFSLARPAGSGNFPAFSKKNFSILSF